MLITFYSCLYLVYKSTPALVFRVSKYSYVNVLSRWWYGILLNLQRLRPTLLNKQQCNHGNAWTFQERARQICVQKPHTFSPHVSFGGLLEYHYVNTTEPTGFYQMMNWLHTCLIITLIIVCHWFTVRQVVWRKLLNEVLDWNTFWIILRVKMSISLAHHLIFEWEKKSQWWGVWDQMVTELSTLAIVDSKFMEVYPLKHPASSMCISGYIFCTSAAWSAVLSNLLMLKSNNPTNVWCSNKVIPPEISKKRRKSSWRH